MAVKHRRREIILGLLREHRVENQESLQTMLERHGVQVAQATLSRDLRDLGVLKGPLGYTLPVPGSASNGTHDRLGRDLEDALRSSLLSAEVGGNLVVLKTGPGRASLVALEIDRHPPAGVLGTVAGDDTVLIATKAPSAAHSISRRFRKLIGA